jgi:hypothetical protein
MVLTSKQESYNLPQAGNEQRLAAGLTEHSPYVHSSTGMSENGEGRSPIKVLMWRPDDCLEVDWSDLC